MTECIFYNFTHSIFLMHSHSYFKTRLHWFLINLIKFFFNQSTRFIIFSGEWCLFELKKMKQLISHLLMIFVILQIKIVIICSPYFLHIDFLILLVQLVATIVNFGTTTDILKQRWETGNKTLFLCLLCFHFEVDIVRV